MLDKLREEVGPEFTRVITFAVFPDGLTGERPNMGFHTERQIY
jgi:hypothetical protein